jgi:predicted GNAT family N-acyltransferase
LLSKHTKSYSNILIQVIEHGNLNIKLLHEICKLKKTIWPYSLKDQKEYIRKIGKKNDLHICLFNKSSLIGYTFLKKKKFIDVKSNKFVLLDTIVIKNKFQKKGFSKLLMTFNNFIIQKKIKDNGMLICKKNFVNFYKSFGWKIVKEKKIKKNFKLKKDIYLMILKS